MKLKKLAEDILGGYLDESNTAQSISTKYYKKNVIFHCSDDFRKKFDLEYIKGGSRGIHGWGIYFADTVFKASDYGDYLTIVDKSNLKLLSLDEIITKSFIDNIERSLDYNNFDAFRKEINTNSDFENLRLFNFDKLDDLEVTKYQLEDKLNKVRNNKEFNEITSIISNIDKLLDRKLKNDSDELLSIIKKNSNNKINDLLSFISWNKPTIYEKKLSIFFKECGYDGFNYDDYEYIIFNTDNLKVLEHIKIR